MGIKKIAQFWFYIVFIVLLFFHFQPTEIMSGLLTLFRLLPYLLNCKICLLSFGFGTIYLLIEIFMIRFFICDRLLFRNDGYIYFSTISISIWIIYEIMFILQFVLIEPCWKICCCQNPNQERHEEDLRVRFNYMDHLSSRARFNEATSNPGIPKNSTDIYDEIYNFSNPRTTQHVQQLVNNDDIIQLETFNVSNVDADIIHEHVSIGR